MKKLILVVAVAVLLTSASAAQATILTWDGINFQTGPNRTSAEWNSSGFGDNVAVGDSNMSVSNGATPDITIVFADTAGGSAWTTSEWFAVSYGYSAAPPLDNCWNWHNISLTPASGKAVIVDSFDFETGNFGQNHSYTWELYKDIVEGSPYLTGSGILPGNGVVSLTTGMASAYDGTLIFRFTALNIPTPGRGQCTYLDNFSFTESDAGGGAVPEPSALALVALGILGLGRRRK